MMQQAQKLRMTTQRQVILDELKRLKSHPTAGELCEIVRRRLPRISLGTVYRNLEILSRTGHIQKIDVAGVEMRFDGDTSDHYHVRCLGCGAVADLEMALSSQLELEANRQSDFQITGHRVEFVGLCPACQDKKSRH
ncbi:ferric uptake regulator, Fur family [Desulfarculus baarsii DSM 2075]|uniref:Ferric uptake regulator, Fur family n=1 Tax=Desulfarculus baarsii (strain ATCC 33931 / DSM 2075 / LMG 7858 / VKM B-1802 / 2st14) TaxID=644282 RepID=E1QIA1_DESB2|nr:transcriptional repressor [Desulfarculus baarsii]ADK85418.1 ferric uptake regulator, Fur family [Desulfarculus baarsii DSM 2075]